MEGYLLSVLLAQLYKIRYNSGYEKEFFCYSDRDMDLLFLQYAGEQ